MESRKEEDVPPGSRAAYELLTMAAALAGRGEITTVALGADLYGQWSTSAAGMPKPPPLARLAPTVEENAIMFLRQLDSRVGRCAAFPVYTYTGEEAPKPALYVTPVGEVAQASPPPTPRQGAA